MTREHGARVPIPPPVIFFVPLLVLLLVDRFLLPWRVPEPAAAWLRVLGLALIAVGVVLVAWSAVTLRVHHTTIAPHRAVRRVVTSGPFRFSRNPIYVAMTLVYLGAALLAGTWWPLPFLPLVLVLLFRLVIRREERYLTETFGRPYGAYRRRVRRWL